MSWNFVYPVLSDEMVDQYERSVTPAQKQRMEEWFGVGQVLNPKVSKHVVALSLFWKNVDLDQPDLPAASEETIRNAVAKGLVSRHAPWEHYVEPLLRGAAKLRAECPEVVLRVYLAKDMAWLTGRLTDLGCEVRIMKSSSLRHMPGALWRFLAMEDAEDIVSFLDTDNLDKSVDLVRGAESLKGSELLTWRRPNANVPEVDAAGWMVYRPVIAWPLATRLRLPVRTLMEAFVWHSIRGSFPSLVEYPGKGRIPYFGTRWPGYGFDEWFLSVALYPRLAAGGMVTEIISVREGYCLALDLEYASWVNPANETLTPLRMVKPSMTVPGGRGRKLQFGTSGNMIPGWENFDYPEVDITRPLPFPDACARFIFLEHVIEHVTARDAWGFFEECRRVLEPGGVLRLAFPDVVKIFRSADPCYHKFIAERGWGDGSKSSSVKVIIFEHGHQAVWTAEAMMTVLEAQGFGASRQEVGQSSWKELCGIEQHGNAVGHAVNDSETVVIEGVNLSPAVAAGKHTGWGLPD